MSKSTPKTFVFNDGTKNSYGFMIPTEGIRLDRFKKNPVMLDSHFNSNHSVLGKWTTIKNEKGLLTGVPLFDNDDEYAAKIAGKVERDFISSCSMGVTFHPDDLKYIGGNLVLEKCELYEVSIVAVPSNENAIRLYSPEGELMNESEVQKLCLSAIPVTDEKVINENQNNKDMKKITLAAAIFAMLGFDQGTTEVEPNELEAKIKALHAEKNAAALKLSAKLEEEEAAKLTAITEKVENGISNKLLSADKKDQYIQLGVVNETLLDDVLANAPKKTSLAAQVQGKGGESTKVETVEDFQKLDTQAQLAFKQTQPDAYMKLFKK